jgi:hypothetical protein
MDFLFPQLFRKAESFCIITTITGLTYKHVLPLCVVSPSSAFFLVHTKIALLSKVIWKQSIAGADLSKGWPNIPLLPRVMMLDILGVDVILGSILSTTVREFHLMVQEVKAVTCAWEK